MNRDHPKCDCWRFDRQVCDVCQGVTGPERDTSACRCDCVNCVTGHCDGCYYSTHAKEGDSTPPAAPVEPPDKWQFAQELMRDRRDIPPGDECDRCGGWGVTTYGNTATWRGGIGGCAMTAGVCDRCWGSGNRHKPWPSRRASHPPAVSGEGERLNRATWDRLLSTLKVAKLLNSNLEDRADVQDEIKKAIDIAEDLLRASTPTPGAPR